MLTIYKGSGANDTVIHVAAENLEDFKTLVKRAMATWQNPPIEMVKFQDNLLDQVQIMAPTYKTPVAFKCSECRTIPCSCTFQHY